MKNSLNKNVVEFSPREVNCILHTPYDYEKLTAFRKEFVETDDTNNTQRCVDLIMTFLTEGINDR